MFLTPFLDFGDPIERVIGQRACGQENQDSTVVVAPVANAPVPLKVRIVCVSDKLRILAVSEQGTALAGSGLAMVSGPIDQSKAYFEISVQEDDTAITIGAVGRNPNSVLAAGWRSLANVPNSMSVSLGKFQKGHVVGVLINISDFPPTVTGYTQDDVVVKQTSQSVRGDLWPAVEIAGSATVVFARDKLQFLTPHRLSRGVEALMISRAII